MNRPLRLSRLLLPLLACTAIVQAQAPRPVGPELVRVVASPGAAVSMLRGELRPYQEVDLHARVDGFIERLLVDRGSTVKTGQTLAVLTAPELDARLAEAAATREVAQARLAEAQARLTALQAADARLADAARTPGVISGQELVQSREDTRAAQAAVTAAQASVTAATAAAEAVRRTRSYLQIRAPFAGVVTERLVHPGALVGPGTGPALRLAQVNRVRLVVAVPEGRVSPLARGRMVTFTTAAHPGATFSGRVARDAGTLDTASRTMAVEADVVNADGRLAPGMYADVQWPGANGHGQLRVPSTSVVRTTQRVFVIRARNGRAEWVDVRLVARQTDTADVVGPLAVGDQVVRRGSDELRDGAALTGVAP
jgi:membrane fusion protein (multidrug efflux system)